MIIHGVCTPCFIHLLLFNTLVSAVGPITDPSSYHSRLPVRERKETQWASFAFLIRPNAQFISAELLFILPSSHMETIWLIMFNYQVITAPHVAR